MKPIRAMTRAAVAGLLVATAATSGALVSAAPAAAAASTFTVNLAGSTGAVLHGANGALYGVSDAGVPSANLVTPLNVTTIAQGPPGDTQHPNGDAGKISASFEQEDGNGKILVYLQDIYSDWPYQTVTLASYESAVNTIMAAIYASPQRADFEIVPFNEPDQQWFDLGGGSSYYSTFYTWWDDLYAEIEADDPGAVIVGPNESGWDASFIPAFLAHAKAAGDLPNVISWHELSIDSLADFASHFAAYQADETAAGVSIPVDIDEYGTQSDLSVPGQLVQWIAMFEKAKVYADLAYWDIAGNFDDLMTGQNSPTGAYWLYYWYARMTGNTVAVTPPDANTIDTLQGVASYDTSKEQAQVILGGSSGSTNVVVDGVSSSVFGSNVTATVEATNWTGYAGAGPAPQVISRATYSTSSGSITVPLTNMNAMSAYHVVLTPSNVTSASSPSVPYSATYYAANAAITDGTVYAQGSESNPGGFATADGEDVGALDEAGSAVAFTVTAPTAGSYDLQIYYGNESGTMAQQALSIDGVADEFVDYPPTLSWVWRDYVTVPVMLSAGTHTITLAVDNSTLGDSIGQVTLDQLIVSAASSTATEYEATEGRTSGSATYGYASSDGSGEGQINLASAASSTVDVFAPSNGYYTTDIRYSANSGSSLTLTANGEPVAGASLPSTSGATETAATSVYLQTGLNPVTLTASGTGSVQDVQVAAAPSSTGTTYEANSSANTLAGTAVVTADQWALDGDYVGYIGDAAANTLTFKDVDASTAGTYMLVIGYSNDDAAGSGNYNSNIESRWSQISVNGGTAVTEVFANTYSWTVFRTVAIPVTLAAGENTIEFSNSTGYAPNIDYIQLAQL
jgi:Carbohydrate binding module (family 35)